MNTAFTISCEFSTPLILGRRLCLDGLLANLLYERLIANGVDEDDAVKRAHREIPLTVRDGIFAGSSAIVSKCDMKSVTIIGSLLRHLTDIPEIEEKLVKNVIKKKNQRAFDKIERRYKNPMTSYVACDFQRGEGVWFTGHGDIAAIDDLLNDINCMGTKRGVGFGKLKQRPTITEVTETPFDGILSNDGDVLRPVPKRIADAWGMQPTNFRMADETARPPYWRMERELCYVPSQQFWPTRTINQFIGE